MVSRGVGWGEFKKKKFTGVNVIVCTRDRAGYGGWARAPGSGFGGVGSGALVDDERRRRRHVPAAEPQAPRRLATREPHPGEGREGVGGELEGFPAPARRRQLARRPRGVSGVVRRDALEELQANVEPHLGGEAALEGSEALEVGPVRLGETLAARAEAADGGGELVGVSEAEHYPHDVQEEDRDVVHAGRDVGRRDGERFLGEEQHVQGVRQFRSLRARGVHELSALLVQRQSRRESLPVRFRHPAKQSRRVVSSISDTLLSCSRKMSTATVRRVGKNEKRRPLPGPLHPTRPLTLQRSPLLRLQGECAPRMTPRARRDGLSCFLNSLQALQATGLRVVRPGIGSDARSADNQPRSGGYPHIAHGRILVSSVDFLASRDDLQPPRVGPGELLQRV